MPDTIGAVAARLINPLIEREGGYVDHPADRGGPTCWGITELVARRAGYAGDMRAVSRSAALEIHWRQYVMASGIDHLVRRSIPPHAAARLQRRQRLDRLTVVTLVIEQRVRFARQQVDQVSTG